MESVRGGVHSHKTGPAMNGIKKLLLAFGGHGRVLVSAFLGQIASGEEKHSGKFMEVGGIKNPAVLGGFHLKSVRFAQFGYGVFQDAGLAVNALHHLMLET